MESIYLLFSNCLGQWRGDSRGMSTRKRARTWKGEGVPWSCYNQPNGWADVMSTLKLEKKIKLWCSQWIPQAWGKDIAALQPGFYLSQLDKGTEHPWNYGILTNSCVTFPNPNLIRILQHTATEKVFVPCDSLRSMFLSINGTQQCVVSVNCLPSLNVLVLRLIHTTMYHHNFIPFHYSMLYSTAWIATILCV